MVRNYKKKNCKNNWTEEQMRQAINYHQSGKSVLAAAREYGIPRSTLQKKICQYNQDDNSSLKNDYKGGFKTVFTMEQEKALVDYILEAENNLMGLTPKDIRKLAFDFAVKLKVKHPFNLEDESAGTDWIKLFMKRHELSKRKPEHTSAFRATGFNKESVQVFFTLLQNLKKKYKFEACNIYNCDETGITVCPKSSPRIVSSIGKRQVGTKTASDRGETVSAEICMSATGAFMPPMLIFPRVRENPDYLNNKPPGAWAVFDKSGWMQCHIFTKWFKKFIEFSRASATNPVLLVLDGHASHVRNLEVIDLARENNVHILCLPPHCSHKMQPLDVGFMKPLSTYYTEALRAFQRTSGAVAMKDIFGIFGSAFLKAAKLETAVNSFKKCGIEPCDSGVFTESDFVSNSRSGLNSNKTNSSELQQLTDPISTLTSTNSNNTVNETTSSNNTNNNYKTIINDIVQSNSQTVIQNIIHQGPNNKPASEKFVQIPLSYIKNAEPLINCLSSILVQSGSSSPQQIFNASHESSTLDNNILKNIPNNLVITNNKTAPKKRKTGKAEVITGDEYKENLVASLSKKIKTEKINIEKKKTKPVVKSVDTLPSKKKNSMQERMKVVESFTNNDIDKTQMEVDLSTIDISSLPIYFA